MPLPVRNQLFATTCTCMEQLHKHDQHVILWNYDTIGKNIYVTHCDFSYCESLKLCILQQQLSYYFPFLIFLLALYKQRIIVCRYSSFNQSSVGGMQEGLADLLFFQNSKATAEESGG